ncbi:hypothetical protein BST61_g404 [Cercospora zeina]
MSSEQPQATPPDIEKYRRTVHNVALAALVTCPILALLPPRKLDIYTIGLIATTGYSANYLPEPFPASRVPQSVVGEMQKEGRVGHDYESGWKAQRQKEIKEDVEEGKDFSDMIIDQIWEVWNQGKGKKEDED